ncbi:MAG: membrane protein insertion efficiency factor YidD [Candidatus Omnitrophica bacterium]|nr:membrane protein insertion efficiency factor YidD [Candidatus Omnitrophota bacterium]
MYLKLRNFSIALIAGYQKFLRPVLPLCCRFEPSCSDYTKQAILKYGIIRGVCKGLARLLRCHPFSRRSGYDPLI